MRKVIDADRDILAVFSSPACAACRTQAPAVESLRRKFPNIFEINVAEKPAIARAFGILATSTAVFMRPRRVEGFLVGIQPDAKLRELIQSSVSSKVCYTDTPFLLLHPNDHHRLVGPRDHRLVSVDKVC